MSTPTLREALAELVRAIERIVVQRMKGQG